MLHFPSLQLKVMYRVKVFIKKFMLLGIPNHLYKVFIQWREQEFAKVDGETSIFILNFKLNEGGRGRLDFCVLLKVRLYTKELPLLLSIYYVLAKHSTYYCHAANIVTTNINPK